MNLTFILVLGLSIATLGLSLPADADDRSTTIKKQQEAIVTGNSDPATQTSKIKVKNHRTGDGGDASTTIKKQQEAIVTGNSDPINQKIKNTVKNHRTGHGGD